MKYPRIPRHLDGRYKTSLSDMKKAEYYRKERVSYGEIAKVLMVNYGTVRKWFDPVFRDKQLKSRSERKKKFRIAHPILWKRYQKKLNKYHTVMVHKRYALDPEYRKYRREATNAKL